MVSSTVFSHHTWTNSAMALGRLMRGTFINSNSARDTKALRADRILSSEIITKQAKDARATWGTKVSVIHKDTVGIIISTYLLGITEFLGFSDWHQPRNCLTIYGMQCEDYFDIICGVSLSDLVKSWGTDMFVIRLITLQFEGTWQMWKWSGHLITILW